MNDGMFVFFEKVFPIIFIGIFVLVFAGIAFTVATLVSPKLRGRMMARQLKGIKYATDYAKKDAEEMVENVRDVAINTQKNIYDKHGDTIREINRRKASMESEALGMKATAIKNALFDEDARKIIGARTGTAAARQIYCSSCGRKIDADARFCKYCGKEQ